MPHSWVPGEATIGKAQIIVKVARCQKCPLCYTMRGTTEYPLIIDALKSVGVEPAFDSKGAYFMDDQV